MAVNNVFGFAQNLAGSFRADKLSADFGGKITGLLVQNVQFSYTQQVTMLYEIGSSQNGETNTYYVGGRAQGSASIARVVGPAVAGASLIAEYGDICNAKNHDIHFKASGGLCGSDIVQETVEYTLHGCTLTAIAVSIAAQDIVINEQLQMMFANLSVGSNVGAGIAPGA